MSSHPQVPIVNSDGTPSREFISDQLQTESSFFTCNSTDLPAVKAVAGRGRYLIDKAKPCWGDGTTWRYADGTLV